MSPAQLAATNLTSSPQSTPAQPSSFADVVKTSIRSALEEDKAKQEVIIQRLPENNRDVADVHEICAKAEVIVKPTAVTRLGKSHPNRPRIVKVTSPSTFDARTFRFKVEESKATISDSFPNICCRPARTRDQQARHKTLGPEVYKLNQNAKSGLESFSLRPNGKRGCSNKAVKGLYLNARSIASVNKSRNKLVELRHLLSSFSAQILAISETWLTDAISDHEVLPDSFNVYRKDRSTTQPSKRGGGILLAIDTNIESNRRDDLENDFVIIVFEIICERRFKIAVILCYKPPDSDSASFNASLTTILDNVYREFQDVCMLGDFNLPAIDWRHPDRCSRATDSEFVCITQSHSLEQINFNPSNAI
ncbi:hypothetical protein CAPTEDRAFT_209156 [Capitella teleta]|uniref:Endonuclease/exonuclease/phosphatase domain-containing protein n=1 Tax=Capitella teleta TaxID=283909 RepID=R7VH38_CAPTE|nr:hypothetical protein CAPTEDRAFT_209156 [Capitella teleta]|eukprot:ELU15010.1 hypothetical protein CAPTEDRAFT_209156 [Capitella teleta]